MFRDVHLNITILRNLRTRPVNVAFTREGPHQSTLIKMSVMSFWYQTGNSLEKWCSKFLFSIFNFATFFIFRFFDLFFDFSDFSSIFVCFFCFVFYAIFRFLSLFLDFISIFFRFFINAYEMFSSELPLVPDNWKCGVVLQLFLFFFKWTIYIKNQKFRTI